MLCGVYNKIWSQAYIFLACLFLGQVPILLNVPVFMRDGLYNYIYFFVLIVLLFLIQVIVCGSSF